jgi:hypothetical protein
MFLKIFGAVLFVLGVFLIIKTEWMLENFGRIDWAEEKLGTYGGTRFFYKVGGLILIFVGLTMIFDMFEGILMWFFSPLLPKQPI